MDRKFRLLEHNLRGFLERGFLQQQRKDTRRIVESETVNSSKQTPDQSHRRDETGTQR